MSPVWSANWSLMACADERGVEEGAEGCTVAVGSGADAPGSGRRVMPVVVGAGNGHRSTTIPGLYRKVLRDKCFHRFYDPIAWLGASDSTASLKVYEDALEKLVVEEMKTAWGQPLRCSSPDLPAGLPAPFDKVRGRQRGFTVDENDVVVLRSWKEWER